MTSKYEEKKKRFFQNLKTKGCSLQYYLNKNTRAYKNFHTTFPSTIRTLQLLPNNSYQNNI